MIKALYSDASTPLKNPSPVGITFAFVVVNENDEEIQRFVGHVTKENCKGYKASNNLAEFIAATKALEYFVDNFDLAPLGQPIKLHLDSELTMNRLFNGYSNKLLPNNVVNRAFRAIQIIKSKGGSVVPVLLAGHPTKKELKAGVKTKNHRNFPVSKWNVLCDLLCREEGERLVTGNWSVA